MEGIKIVAYTFFLLGFQLYFAHCEDCKIEKNVTGKILHERQFGTSQQCWKILVPRDHFVHLKVLSIKSDKSCESDYVRIDVGETSDGYQFCKSNYSKNPIILFGNVTVIHHIYDYYALSRFELEYTLKNMNCIRKSSFVCDDNFCIRPKKICNGVRDCKNGADEIGCEFGVKKIEGVSEAREKAISWLKQKRTAAWGWKDSTHRAVVALYLASPATFNGTVLEEELMAKQAELKAAVTLLRPSLSNSELSTLINALLVTCHSPRKFYGYNLVQRLKEQVEGSGIFTHPLAYLALCNANESWPLKATSDLNSILNSNSEYPFVTDLQAMAILAVSCEANRNENIEDELEFSAQKNIQNFKKLQNHDGSFGNIYTTALITQAFLSNGQGRRGGWNLNATIGHLMEELISSSVDILATYLILPILNDRDLTDISHINCSKNPRKHGDDPVSEVSDHLGLKIRIQYSLYIGEEKDIIHTTHLRVPNNYTAFEVMELAEINDQKYKFEYKLMSGKIYVYEIANVRSDPEAAKFWLLYVGAANNSEALTHLIKDPREVIIGDGEHLVLWYKTATI